jgi:hypothetical protein
VYLLPLTKRYACPIFLSFPSWPLNFRDNILIYKKFVEAYIRGCIKKFPD